MSLDLMVYAGLTPGTSDVNGYEALCEGEDDVAVDSPVVAEFVKELIRRHPDLSDFIWTGDRDRFASFTLPFSIPEAVVREIEDLVIEYGLRGYDPQTEEPLGVRRS
jgi:hypothetical protein